MSNISSNELSIDDVKKEAALDVQKKDTSRRIQLIIFKLGTEEYALSIDQIKEVVLTPRIAKMPQTPSYIKGVANIRGNIIAILDLEEKFGIDNSKNQPEFNSNYTLVIESETYKAGFLVKEVPNTLTITTSDIETASSFVQTTSLDENCIQGVVKSGERLIILIDMVKLMETTSINQIVNKAIK
jgi:purine-binding chemotaxis protein CheW